jgi:hypothetical protein
MRLVRSADPMKRRMKAVGLGLSAIQMVWGNAALACGGCEEDDALYGFLAYIDFRGMNAEQQAAARQSAIDAYHARKMDQAKTAFTSRFKVDPAPQGQKGPENAGQQQKLATQ